MQTSRIPLVKPPALHKGDRIAIVAPASNIREENLARGIRQLEKLGFTASYEPEILSKSRYTAGSDERRASELMRAFSNPEVKAVWAARGGYGTMRLIERLDSALLERHPKIFVGYSDLTAFHLYLYRKFGWVTFHGPMIAKDLAEGEEHYDSGTLLSAIEEGTSGFEIEMGGVETLHGSKDRQVTGRLLGGCLTLVCALMGTDYELDTQDSILFLEDSDARHYQIDRMLEQLRLGGKLDGIRALIFGEMINCSQPGEKDSRLQDMLREITSDLNVPVFYGLKSGHTSSGNLTLPLGVVATLDLPANTLRIDEPAVIAS
jgi:muramoyltetrapeptide carboxypeptidase